MPVLSTWKKLISYGTDFYEPSYRATKSAYKVQGLLKPDKNISLNTSWTLDMIHIKVVEKIETRKLNSVALVRTRTIPTERPPPVGEVSANFCG